MIYGIQYMSIPVMSYIIYYTIYALGWYVVYHILANICPQKCCVYPTLIGTALMSGP
jgi:hypothetical protein